MACLINFAVSRGLEWGPPLFVPPGVLPGVPTPPGVFCPLAVPGDIEVSEETRYGVASAAAEEEDEDEGGGGGGWSDDACFSSVLGVEVQGCQRSLACGESCANDRDAGDRDGTATTIATAMAAPRTPPLPSP